MEITRIYLSLRSYEYHFTFVFAFSSNSVIIYNVIKEKCSQWEKIALRRSAESLFDNARSKNSQSPEKSLDFRRGSEDRRIWRRP